MKYEDRQLLEALASQYVLGTLRGRARQRFERLCIQNQFAQAAVRRWEDRFMSMLSQIKPETPSKHVWSAIERRLGFKQRKEQASAWGWLQPRWAMAAFAGLAALAIAIGLLMQQGTHRLDVIAVISQTERGELWRVERSPGGGKLLIEATAGVAIDAAHAYELWALPANGAAPVSLGLLPTRGKRTLVLSNAQIAALGGAKKIAVSLEPLGGSPTGAPTGPVIHVADLATLG